MKTNIEANLFPDPNQQEKTLPKPVNVATVPQRSPFRYPGGKTWFVPTFRQWMAQLDPKPSILVEPFAGGGIISLTALFENYVNQAIMVELDAEIAAVWRAVIDGRSEWLAKRIEEFDLTRESVINEITKETCDLGEKAFQTILKNRTFHGGILANGSGLLKYGENGKGVKSRWYPETLAKRFRQLESISKRIEFRETDGIAILKEYSDRNDIVFFIDPPYTAGGKKAGTRLYKHYELDHEELFAICDNLKGEFLITYDNADEVRRMAERHGFDFRLVPMKNTHHADMYELVIGRNLLWADRQYKTER